jgi:hypothetical protein
MNPSPSTQHTLIAAAARGVVSSGSATCGLTPDDADKLIANGFTDAPIVVQFLGAAGDATTSLSAI